MSSALWRAAESQAMSLLADDVLDVLTTIIDPELGMNIVDLGLVYDIEVRDNAVSISMTTPACPVAPHLVEQAKNAVCSQFPTLNTVTVQLVWEPAWNPLMMSWKVREQFGWA